MSDPAMSVVRRCTERHPTTKTWTFPPEREAQPNRTNLKELAARPDRFEHHLTVVARLGVAQLEIATASEPVYFAHVNISDEYAVALPTGDAMIDMFPMRTFVSDPGTGADVGRYNHRCGDLVLHPDGYAHWPGKLRPPFAPIPFPAGMRRCVLSLVYCASTRTPSTAPIVALPAGRKPEDIKPYVDPAPTLAIADLLRGAPGVVARVGNSQLELVEKPARIAPPRGGWVVILVGREPCDLIRIAPGETLDGTGIERALVLSGDAEPEPVPPSWSKVPPAGFACGGGAAPSTLPFRYQQLAVTEHRDPDTGVVDPTIAMVTLSNGPVDAGPLRGVVAHVPRYWLARLLYRAALHGLSLNYVETYGGFFLDDSGPDVVIGIRTPSDRFAVTIPRADAMTTIERLYRAIAPREYTERPE